MPWDPTVDFQFMWANTQDFMSLWHSYKPTICDLSKMRRFMASVFHGFAEVRLRGPRYHAAMPGMVPCLVSLRRKVRNKAFLDLW
eukprot:g11409.t1